MATSGKSSEGIFGELLLWNKKALQEFLQARCLPVSGAKELLVSRVFNAIECDIPTVREGEDALRAAREEYKSILKRCKIDDPLEMESGWINEQNGGSAFWPTITSKELLEWHAEKYNDGRRDSMAPYKIDKGFQYYKCDLTQNISYHKVSESSSVCVLMNLCVRSMQRSKEPHEAWVCLDKTCGDVKGAYCSCVVGLSEVCNHVTALLFKIEAVVKEGGNVGTSNLCLWKAPSGATTTLRIDQPIEEILTGWNRSTYTRPNRARPMLSQERASFQPTTPHKKEEKVETVRKEFMTMLSKAQPSAVLLGAATPKERTELGLPTAPPIPVEPSAPQTTVSDTSTISSLWKTFRDSEESENPAEDFTVYFLPEYFKAHPELVTQVANITQGQHENQLWAVQREHRLTASLFSTIKNRQQYIATGKGRARKIDNVKFCENIFRSAQFRPRVNDIPQLAWGVNNEANARREYLRQQQDDHVNLVVIEIGIVVDLDAPFLGASTDGIIRCDCHGTRCLEIKCPYSIRDHDPRVYAPKCLTPSKGLKTTDRYYYQVQGQLGILGLQRCDFFVWTPHGSVTVNVNFDERFWADLKKTLQDFYVGTYIPIMFLEKRPREKTPRKKQLSCTGPRKFRSEKRGSPQAKYRADGLNCGETAKPMEKVESSADISDDECTGLSDTAPKFPCRVCKDECPDEPDDFELCSVVCSRCDRWLHYPCAGFLDSEDVPLDDEEWLCNICKHTNDPSLSTLIDET